MKAPFPNTETNHYRGAVSDIAEDRKDALIGSRTIEQKAIVLKNLIEQTQQKIQIYQKNIVDILNLEEGMINLLISNINHDIKVLFVVDDKDTSNELRALLKNKQFEIREVTQKFKNASEDILHEDYYLTVADDSMFSMDKKNSDLSGITHFNNTVQAKKIQEVFDTLQKD